MRKVEQTDKIGVLIATMLSVLASKINAINVVGWLLLINLSVMGDSMMVILSSNMNIEQYTSVIKLIASSVSLLGVLALAIYNFVKLARLWKNDEQQN